MLRRLVRARLAALLMLVGLVAEATAQAPPAAGVRRPNQPAAPPSAAFEENIDRPGGDYRNFDLAAADARLCAAACAAETQCAAWTYVRPGIQAAAARCWLKASSPPPQPNGCCTSGVTRPPAGIRIDNPAVEGIALDYCLTWATDCGPPAATAFCRSRGYRTALDFTLALARPPTRIIGDGQVCREPFCGAIVSVICAE